MISYELIETLLQSTQNQPRGTSAYGTNRAARAIFNNYGDHEVLTALLNEERAKVGKRGYREESEAYILLMQAAVN